MGMNWGAFAGGVAESGMRTYERLEDVKLKELQRSQLEKEIKEKEALDAAWRDSQARVGQQDDYSKAINTGAGMGPAGTQQSQMLSDQGALKSNTPEDQEFERESAKSVAGALRENAVRKGAVPESQAALPAMKPGEYTADQGMKDYVKAAGQVSRKGTLEALQLKGVMRESDLQDKFDVSKKHLDDQLAIIHGTGETGGLKGLYEVGKKEGLNLKLVEGKNGVGTRIQILGPKGDVIETVSDVASATQKLSDAAMHQFAQKSVTLLGSAEKFSAYMQNERKTVAAEKSAQADIEYKGKGGVIDRAYQNGAKGGGGSNTTERILAKADELAKDKTSKFYGKKEDAYEFLKRGAVKNDDAMTWNDIEKKLRGDGASKEDIAAQRAGFFGPERGYAPPQAVALLQTGKDPKGNPLTDSQLNDFNRKFPKTPWQDILGEDNRPGGLPVPK